MKKTTRKAYVLGARVEPQQLDKIRQRLDALSMNPSEYVRHLVERDLQTA